MSEKEVSNESNQDLKQDARDSRLRPMRKNNEEVLRKKFQLLAQQKCAPFFKNFGDCAKESGLMVVFNCRKQNSAMSACMEQHCNEEEFQKFLLTEGITQKLRKKESWIS